MPIRRETLAAVMLATVIGATGCASTEDAAPAPETAAIASDALLLGCMPYLLAGFDFSSDNSEMLASSNLNAGTPERQLSSAFSYERVFSSFVGDADTEFAHAIGNDRIVLAGSKENHSCSVGYFGDNREAVDEAWLYELETDEAPWKFVHEEDREFYSGRIYRWRQPGPTDLEASLGTFSEALASSSRLQGIITVSLVRDESITDGR